MDHKLLVRPSDSSAFEMPLGSGPMRLGSDANCEIRIEHAEMPPHAATVDFRDGSYYVQNHNSFTVYVGSEPVTPNAWAHWPSGHQLQLTRSVAISLEPVAGVVPGQTASQTTESAEPARQSTAAKTVVQIAVIGGCMILGLLMLLNPEQSSGGAPQDSFHNVLIALEQKQPFTEDDDVLRGYLQEAWILDLRDIDADRTSRAYELLMAHPRIRRAEDDDGVDGRIKRFAAWRLEVLGSGGELGNF